MSNMEWLQNIYLEYRNLVYRVSVSITKDQGLAEDVMQDVFVTLHQKASHIRDKSKVKAWLVKTATNRSIDMTRRAKKVVYMPEEDFNRHENGSSWADPTLPLDEKEAVEEIRQALEELPPEQKALILLYYYMEMPQHEIAASLDIPLGTVKTRLKRAREKLKVQLGSQKQEGKKAPRRPPGEKGVPYHE